MQGLDDLELPSMGGEYYWIAAIDPENPKKLIVLGYYTDEEKANRVGYEKINGHFEVVALDTRNTARATQQLKYRMFDKTSDLGFATRRAKHKIKGDTDNGSTSYGQNW